MVPQSPSPMVQGSPYQGQVSQQMAPQGQQMAQMASQGQQMAPQGQQMVYGAAAAPQAAPQPMAQAAPAVDQSQLGAFLLLSVRVLALICALSGVRVFAS